MTSRWFFWPLSAALALGASQTACKPSDPPILVGSVKKLGGAPARVLQIAFSGDGNDVLVAERRAPDAGEWGPDDQFALTKRRVADGSVVELQAFKQRLVHFVPFGDGALYVHRRSLPSSLPELPIESEERRETRRMLKDSQARARKDTALAEVHPGAAATQVSPPGRTVFGLAGAANGEWAAYSTGADKSPDEPADAEVHVLGLKEKSDVVLTRTGVVYDISPDGARVLLLRRFPERGAKGAPEIPAPSVFDTTAVSLVDVKANGTLILPGVITVDGAEIKTDALAVNLTATGLLFRSKEGDVYRSELDGSKAIRVAGPATTGPVATASGTAALPAPSASSSAAAAPGGAAVRVVTERGSVLELRDDGGGVEVSQATGDKAHPKTVSARLEAPFSAIGPVAVDSTGSRIAFAVVSDTSRDGTTSAVDDDATVFLSDPAKGSVAIERAQTGLLADELRQKITSALSIPPEQVLITHAGRKLEVTVQLPLNDDDKAPAVVARWIAAAKGLKQAVPINTAVRKVRVGPFEALVPVSIQEITGSGQTLLRALARVVQDPAGSPLVHHDPSLTTISGGAFPRTLSGIFENKGTEPIGPVVIMATTRPDPRYRGTGPDPNRREASTSIGPIEPGKKMAYRLKIWEQQYGDFDIDYLVDGKSVTPINLFAMEDTHHILNAALDLYREHGVVLLNDLDLSPESDAVRVQLADKHLAMPDAERATMMTRVAKTVAKHFVQYHRDYSPDVLFLKPGGGGFRWSGGNVQPVGPERRP